jgi:hypothetical protein
VSCLIGQYACVEMPENLRTLVDDFRSKRIDQKTFAARVKALKKYEMVTKQKADERGIGERVGCRAANHSLTVKCAHKPESMKERLTLDRDGNMSDLRPTIVTIEQAAAMTDAPPTICQSQAVTLKPTDGGKYRQALPIGDEHTDIYNRSRQSHEGMNGFTRDDAREALGTPGRRRVPTNVAQQLIAAFLVAAANMRKSAPSWSVPNWTPTATTSSFAPSGGATTPGPVSSPGPLHRKSSPPPLRPRAAPELHSTTHDPALDWSGSQCARIRACGPASRRDRREERNEPASAGSGKAKRRS